MFRVEAVQSNVDVDDLGLKIPKGSSVSITDEQKKSSSCLRLLERLGKVIVSSGGLSRTEKPAPKPEKTPRKKHEVQSSSKKIVEGKPSTKNKTQAPAPVLKSLRGRTQNVVMLDEVAFFGDQTPVVQVEKAPDTKEKKKEKEDKKAVKPTS